MLPVSPPRVIFSPVLVPGAVGHLHPPGHILEVPGSQRDGDAGSRHPAGLWGGPAGLATRPQSLPSTGGTGRTGSTGGTIPRGAQHRRGGRFLPGTRPLPGHARCGYRAVFMGLEVGYREFLAKCPKVRQLGHVAKAPGPAAGGAQWGQTPRPPVGKGWLSPTSHGPPVATSPSPPAAGHEWKLQGGGTGGGAKGHRGVQRGTGGYEGARGAPPGGCHPVPGSHPTGGLWGGFGMPALFPHNI